MIEPVEDQPLDLRKYLSVLRVRKWTILLVATLVTGLAVFWSYRQTPIYQTSTRVLLKADPASGYFPVGETESQLAGGVAVAQVVIKQQGLDMRPAELLSGLVVQPATQAGTVLTITYKSSDPAFAQLAANGFAQGYISYKQTVADELSEDERGALEKRLADLRAQLENLIGRITAATREGNDGLVRRLEFRRSFVEGEILTVNSELRALGPDTSGDDGRFGEVLNPAGLPSVPSSPNHQTDTIMGLIIGIGLGIGMGFLRERLDDRFRGRPDVERAIEAPVLATVPRFPKNRRTRDLIVISEPKGSASEAYRNLRTSLQFLLTQRNAKTLLITSPSEHEGKTATVANLGFALAQTGRRVVLVSADLRRPQLERYFGVKAEVGLSNYLLGEVDDIGEIVLEDPNLPGLRLLPSGPVPTNPAELLTSPRVAELVKELEKHTDILIFDAPPVLPVADSVILASHLGIAVLILDAANTQRSAAVHAKELIERVGAEVIGCVLNAFDPGGSPYYYEPYYYSQYYSKPEEGEATNNQASHVDLDAPERQGSA